MNLAIGIAAIVLGIVLVVFGINESESLASDVSKFFTGNPTDRSIWFIAGGIVAIIAGLVVGFGSKILKRVAP